MKERGSILILALILITLSSGLFIYFSLNNNLNPHKNIPSPKTQSLKSTTTSNPAKFASPSAIPSILITSRPTPTPYYYSIKRTTNALNTIQVSVKVGDKIGGMVVVPKRSYREYSFSGEITLSGKYYYADYPEGKYLGEPFYGSDVICFDSDDIEAEKSFPRVAEDERKLWFCFSNKEFALQQFMPVGSFGKAKIVIDEYEYTFASRTTYNVAKLVRVVGK